MGDKLESNIFKALIWLMLRIKGQEFRARSSSFNIKNCPPPL